MNRKQKAAVMAAGVALTAAVGSANLPDSAQELVDSTQALYAKSEERGMELPENPGIRDVRDEMYVMAPTQGRDMVLTISAEGALENGDNLTLCHQFTAGDKIFLHDNATLLAVDTTTYKDTDYAVIVFNAEIQGGEYAFMGAAKLGAEAELCGVVMISDVPLTEADVAIIPTTGLAVAVYPKGGVAWERCVQIGEDGSLVDYGSTDWATGNPKNLSVATDEYISIAFTCVRTVNDVPTITLVHGFQEVPDARLAITEPMNVTAERYPILHDLTFDPDFAPEQWDMDATGDQGANGGFFDSGTVYLSCPKADGMGHNVITFRTDTEVLHPVSHTERTFAGEVNGPTSVEAGTVDYAMGLVATTNRDPGNSEVWATLRLYSLENNEETLPNGQDMCSTMAVTAQEITDVDITGGFPGSIGMVADDTFYLTAWEAGVGDRGPTQAIAYNIARAAMLDQVDGTVWAVIQDKDGFLWLVPYTPEKVVRKAYSGDTVDGTAIQGGEPGATCKASIWRPADDAYFQPIEGGENQA